MKWLHCWYAPNEVPEHLTEPKAGDRRVHPCHFKPEDILLTDRKGGSGACSSHAYRSPDP